MMKSSRPSASTGIPLINMRDLRGKDCEDMQGPSQSGCSYNHHIPPNELTTDSNLEFQVCSKDEVNQHQSFVQKTGDGTSQLPCEVQGQTASTQSATLLMRNPNLA